MTQNKWQYVLARCLIIIGSIIGIVPLAIYLSLPIYLSGVFLLFKSSKVKRIRLYWTILPLIGIMLVWAIIFVTSPLFNE